MTDLPIDSVIIDLFKSGALVEEPTIEDCTLTNGEVTSCYRITVIGTPVDHNEGPYCPPYTFSSAEEGGIWLDGENVYDVDGQFILDLASIYPNEDDPERQWLLHYGDTVSIRNIITGESNLPGGLPGVGSCLEGFSDDLVDGQPTTTVVIPITPILREEPGALGRRDTVGVALNGVKFEGPAPIELILSGNSIGVFDDCAGHLNPQEGYHYHGHNGEGCSEVYIKRKHAPAIGYVMDGHLLYSMTDSKGNEPTDLDACRGHTDEKLGYHYHAASVAENMFIGCYSGETVRVDRPAPPQPPEPPVDDGGEEPAEPGEGEEPGEPVAAG